MRILSFAMTVFVWLKGCIPHPPFHIGPSGFYIIWSNQYGRRTGMGARTWSDNMQGRDITILLLALMLLNIGASSFVSGGEEEAALEPKNGKSDLWYPLHLGFRLISNPELANRAIAESWPGSGTKEDPYVLDGYSFVENTGTISIDGTTLHFRISNCSFETTSGGVNLDEASNITLENISFIGPNRPSISIDTCSNITLRKFDISNGPETGIAIGKSSDIVVDSATIRNATRYPFILDRSDSVKLRNLVITNHTRPFHIDYCNNVEITGGNISEGQDVGLGLFLVQDLSISSCNFFRNSDHSLETYGLEGLVVTDCRFEDFSRSGLHLRGTRLLLRDNYFKGPVNGLEINVVYDLVMYGNTFVDCGIGIWNGYGGLEDSIIPENNTANGLPILMLRDTDYNGAVLDDEFGQLLLANVTDLVVKDEIISRVGTAVAVVLSSGITIDGSTCSDTVTSIYCRETDNLTIKGSDLHDFRYYGIRASDCSDVSIEGNDIRNGLSEGIRVGSERALIDGNTISNVRGNLISASGRVVISSNEISDCEWEGIRALNSDDQWIYLNNVQNCNQGILVAGPGNSTIEANELDSNLMGISVREDSMKVGPTNFIIKDNTIASMKGDGIEISGKVNATLYGNIMTFSGLRAADPMSNIILPGNNTLNGRSILLEKDLNGALESEIADPAQVILLNCSSLSLEGHSFPGVSSAVQLSKCSNIAISNISISDSLEGFYLTGCPDISILNSTFVDDGTAVRAFDSPGLSVRDVEIKGGGIGLDLVRTDNARLDNVLCRDLESMGMDLGDMNNIDLGFSFFLNCSVGAIFNDRIDHCTIHNNIFFDCSGPGLIMGGESRFDRTRYNTIRSNVFLFNNGSTATYDPSRMQATEKGDQNHWNGSGKGNYWSDWQGPDPNGDGIVDEPFSIPGEGKGIDHYPLKEVPFTIISEPGSFRGKVGNGWVNLSWSPPEIDYLGSGYEYVIYRAVGPLDPEPLVQLGPSSTWYNDTTTNGIEHSYYMMAVNSLGSSDPTYTLRFLPDGAPPVIISMSPEEGTLINSTNVTVTWNVTDAHSGIRSIELRMDENMWFDVTGDEYLTFSYLEDGAHIIGLKASDLVGNHVNRTVNITIDTTPPDIDIFWPEGDNITDLDDVEIGWNCSDPSGIYQVWAMIDGGMWEEYGPNFVGTFTDLRHGTHTVVVLAIDSAGNRMEEEADFIVDLIPPTIEILEPDNDILIKEASALLSWVHSDDGSGVSTVICAVDGEFQWNVTWAHTSRVVDLEEGFHVITLTAVDRAGNMETARLEITVDTISPSVQSHRPTGIDNEVDAEIMAEFSEEMDRENTTLSIIGVEGSVSWEGNTIVFTPSGALNYGKEYTAVVNGKDLAGNTVEFSWKFTTKEIPADGDDDGTGGDDNNITGIIILSAVVILVCALVIVLLLVIRSRKGEIPEE